MTSDNRGNPSRTLAPIVLFVYARPDHTEQTLEALKANYLAAESTLYIYADGPKESANAETLARVAAVRSVIKAQSWCGEVVLLESAANKGLSESIKSGVSEVLAKHGRAIVLEDDLVTSPAFLTYMNSALDFYESRKSVFSISAYCLPPAKLPIPDDYAFDVFVSLRNSSWGWATWQDRWQQVNWAVPQFETVSRNSDMKQAFNRGGEDLFSMLEAQQRGELNVWAVQFTFSHFVNHAVSIVPTQSYIANIGMDGSGENSGTSKALQIDALNQKEEIKFVDALYQDSRLINSFYSFYYPAKRPLWQKAVNRMSRLVGGESVFTLKKKIYD